MSDGIVETTFNSVEGTMYVRLRPLPPGGVHHTVYVGDCVHVDCDDHDVPIGVELLIPPVAPDPQGGVYQRALHRISPAMAGHLVAKQRVNASERLAD